MADSRPTTPASSVTATDAGLDSESLRRKELTVSNWELVTAPAGVNVLTLNHKYEGHGTEQSPFVVDFLPDDPHNAMNFPHWKKWTFTIIHAFATMAVSFASSAYSGGVTDIIREFNVSVEITTLGISLFVVGFAVGPLLWAPLSGQSCLIALPHSSCSGRPVLLVWPETDTLLSLFRVMQSFMAGRCCSSAPTLP